jgi:hypothetical protein
MPFDTAYVASTPPALNTRAAAVGAAQNPPPAAPRAGRPELRRHDRQHQIIGRAERQIRCDRDNFATV